MGSSDDGAERTRPLWLFMRALEVINAALAEHPNGPRLGPPGSGSERREGERRIGVLVYEGGSGRAVERFVVAMADGRVELLSRGESCASPDWSVSLDHIRSIVDSPGHYVDRPELLQGPWFHGSGAEAPSGA